MLIITLYPIATKVWCPADEAEPEGLFNKASCPEAPPNWFREEPEVAAELYAMERHSGRHQTEYEVLVRCDQGKLHKFTVKVGYELTAHVRAA